MSDLMSELNGLTDSDEEDTQKDKYLTFRLGTEHYGLEIRYVTEIIKLQPITEVPQVPDYVRGIINLRGKIVPVMDVRLRFCKQPCAYDERTCVVVVDVNSMCIGLIVDSVSEVTSIPDESIVPPPELNHGGKETRFVRAIGKVGDDVRLILDCHRLLDGDDVEQVQRLDRKEDVYEMAQ